MHADRLMKLSDMLYAKTPEVNFDLSGWGSVYRYCGTTACAVGFAVASGEFEEYGLAPQYNAFLPVMRKDTPVSDRVIESWHKRGINWKLDDSWQSVCALFDITLDEAEFLFSSHGYDGFVTTGRQGELNVADRIRGFVWAGGVFEPGHFAKDI